MSSTAQLDLDFCFRQLNALITRENAPWRVVKNNALLSSFAIDRALGRDHVYCQRLIGIIRQVHQNDGDLANPEITLRLATLVYLAMQTHDASTGAVR